MKKLNVIIKKKKNLIALFLIASVLVSLPYAAEQVYATSAHDKKNEAQENLKDVQNEMNDIKDKQNEVEGELKDVRKQLSQLISNQNALKAEVSATEKELKQTQKELDQAKKDAADQYKAMKIRIQFMYENSSDDNLWTAILESDGIADMLNRVEYISTIYESDRELTNQYKQTIAKIEQKEIKLSQEMDELLAKQEAFLGQQAEIESMVASLEGTKQEYASQLASAKRQAEAYQKTIKEQDRIIQSQQNATNKPSNSTDKKPSNDGKNVTGEALVSYARQFVGNPYVWGGNSLTKGCDCSGFVHLVYKKFGYNLVRHSMSFLNEGVPVDREDIQPGDIVVYARKNGVGHVAIYAGNGKIVEAQSTKAGITDNRSVDCRTIVGIRRVLPNP